MYIRVALWKAILCSAVITVATAATAGAAVTVSQKPQNFKYNGATGNIGVTFTQISSATATISAEPAVGWITLTAPVSGTAILTVKKGKAVGKVQYRVAANDSSLNRSGAINVNGTPVDVKQTGIPCKVKVSAAKTSVGTNGGETSFAVDAPAGCGWSAAVNGSGSAWAAILSGESGTGHGTVTVSTSANSAAPRTATVVVTATDPNKELPVVTDKKQVVIKQAKGTVSPSLKSMKVAEKVSVVDAKGAAAATAPERAPSALRISAETTATDFQKDVTHYYVDERTSDAFNTANEILCMIAQSKYDLMLNKGPYIALVDQNLCKSKQESGSADEQAQSSTPDYMFWTVDSSRANNNSPEIIRAWIRDIHGDHDREMMINARVEIAESASETNPYGLFSMSIAGYPVSDGVINRENLVMRAMLSAERDTASGKVLLKFVMQEQSTNEQGQPALRTNGATLTKSADGSGAGTIRQSGDGAWPIENNFAFNSDYFHRTMTQGGEDDVCLDRTDFARSAWRYGLYDADGARVNVNSGFPIKATKGDVTAYGWVGYWGMWLPNSISLATGDSVYKQSFSGTPDTTPYKVLAAGGKLKKHTKQTTTLGALKNVPLNLWLQSGPSGQGNYRIAWNGTNFDITGYMQNESQYWTEMTPTPLSVGSTGMDELNFWAEGLGQGRIKVPCTRTMGQMGPGEFVCSNPIDATVVVYYAEDIVYPGEAVPQLACFDNCPNAATITTANPYKEGNSWMPQNVPPSQSAYTLYSFDASSMTLTDGGQPLVAATSATQWQNIQSGALFAPTPENLTTLACEWDANMTCGWKAWSNLDLFYTWETGPNSWNRLTLLTDPDGKPLKFSPPIRVNYVHNQADVNEPDTKYNGAKFRLEYQGFGQLQGIPGHCIDRATGQATECKQDSENRWVADFMIREGATVTDEATQAIYKVKPLEVEEHMKKVTTGCEDLSTDTKYQLPNLDTWIDPAIGPEPAVAASPAVIGGALQ